MACFRPEAVLVAVLPEIKITENDGHSFFLDSMIIVFQDDFSSLMRGIADLKFIGDLTVPEFSDWVCPQ